MSYQATVVEILVAGPGDVLEERRTIAEAIETWNQHHAHHMGLVMRPVMWETDTYPELGEDAQSIINRQMAGRCVAAIAVFATRLGTPTPRAASGTAEEIDRFDREGKPVAVYFSEGQADLTRLNPVQFQALQEYKESLRNRNRGLDRGYSSVAHLRQLIDQHLAALGYRFQASQQAQEPEQVSSTSIIFEPTENDMRVLAAVGRSMVQTGSPLVSSLYLHDAPELSGASQDDIFESLRVLRHQNLITGTDEPGYGRWEITLTSNGLEMWLLNFIRDYDLTQRRIARAIVLSGIRDVTNISANSGVPRTIVEHVLQRWGKRGLVIVNRLYDESRVDRFSSEVRKLAEAERTDGEETVPTITAPSNRVERGPRYRTVAKFIGVDVVALSDVGGELGDPVAAAVKVGGWTVVQVVAPSERSEWTAAMEERFRSEVRRLAAHHDLLGRQGEVRVVFDLPQSTAETQDTAAGESIERQDRVAARRSL